MSISHLLSPIVLLGTCLALAGCGSPVPATVEPVSKTLGGRGSGPGMFSHPRGLDVMPDGRIAVADKTGRIQILSSEGESITEWLLPKIDNGTPTGLVFDLSRLPAPTLLVADTHNSRILRYTLEGELIQEFGEYGSEAGKMIFPTDVAVDPEGNIFVTDYGGSDDRVIKFARDGTFLKQWGTYGTAPGEFNRPMGIVWTEPGRIVVADSCNHRIQAFSDDGKLIAVWGEVGSAPGRFNYPYDLALNEDGILFVAEYGNNRIQCLGSDGRVLGIFGKAGTRPGQFGTPWGIALSPSGGVTVADTNNHRLQVMRVQDLLYSDI
ncbi:SMP-30/gluconolactonase/LRE family protein [Candidatus Sumerlaeota bacterium]|nr:SMP-30/gluconolactonase/LRE family protein [Candidatus Sumerlaeota bacterium]